MHTYDLGEFPTFCLLSSNLLVLNQSYSLKNHLEHVLNTCHDIQLVSKDYMDQVGGILAALWA